MLDILGGEQGAEQGEDTDMIDEFKGKETRKSFARAVKAGFHSRTFHTLAFHITDAVLFFGFFCFVFLSNAVSTVTSTSRANAFI